MAIGTNNRGITEGMVVYSADGDRVGKVVRCGADSFEIEKGFFFPKDYLVRYTDVTRVSGDDIYLMLSKDQLRGSWDAQSNVGRTTDTSAGYSAGATNSTYTGREQQGASNTSYATNEVRVPVAEEQLDVTKVSREAGAVRIKKDVVTETKEVSVPITREEVHVERVAVDAPRAAREGEALFQESTVVVPVREEEVQVSKRAVVKEEVRVSKDVRQDQTTVRETVRKERVDVDDDTTLGRGSSGDAGMHAGGLGVNNDVDSGYGTTNDPLKNSWDPDKKF